MRVRGAVHLRFRRCHDVHRWAVLDNPAKIGKLVRCPDIGPLRAIGCRAAHVAFWQILLKKSFPADERNFSGPLMRFARRDVGDHNAFHKNDNKDP